MEMTDSFPQPWAAVPSVGHPAGTPLSRCSRSTKAQKPRVWYFTKYCQSISIARGVETPTFLRTTISSTLSLVSEAPLTPLKLLQQPHPKRSGICTRRMQTSIEDTGYQAFTPAFSGNCRVSCG